MKRSIFCSLFFLFVVLASHKVQAQENPDLKYNKAKKEYRDSHPASQQINSTKRQSESEAIRPASSAAAAKSKKTVDAKVEANSKGLKNNEVKNQ